MTQYFHGSPEKFKRFNKPNSGNDYGVGIYLTLNLDEAIQYALKSDADGYIYTVTHKNLNSFDTTCFAHAELLRKYIEASSPILRPKPQDRFNYFVDEFGFDKSMRYSFYHQTRSIYGLDIKETREFNEYILEAGFDSILDPVKGWLIVLKPEFIKIDSITPLKISQFEFRGPLGDMKFIKKLSQ